MITATGLTKRYGDTVAVDDLTFEAKPGIVTGILRPNGAGKTTSTRRANNGRFCDTHVLTRRPSSSDVSRSVIESM